MDSDNIYEINIENPLDAIERIISLKRWDYSRANEDELISDIKSDLCSYRLYLAWLKDINAISLTITFDITVPHLMKPQVYELLSLINENLWIGHFDITSKAAIPAYRNTYLFKEKNLVNINILEDLVDIGINECEKFYNAFQMVLWGEYTAHDAVATCLFETKGQA